METAKKRRIPPEYRDSRKRFTKGNPGGPGRPKQTKEERERKRVIREQAKNYFKQTDTAHGIAKKSAPQLMEHLIEKALDGDTNAAKIVLDRGLGTALPASRKVNLQGLEQLPPLQRQQKLLELVSTGQLGLDESQQVSKLLTAAIQDSQLQVITAFIQDLRTIGPEAAARKALGHLRNEETTS